MRPIAILVGLMAGSMLSGGIFNVIELPFAEEELGTGDSGYSALVAVLGVGFLLGSLAGAGGGTPSLLKRRFVQGIFLTGSREPVHGGIAGPGDRAAGLRARVASATACS